MPRTHHLHRSRTSSRARASFGEGASTTCSIYSVRHDGEEDTLLERFVSKFTTGATLHSDASDFGSQAMSKDVTSRRDDCSESLMDPEEKLWLLGCRQASPVSSGFRDVHLTAKQPANFMASAMEAESVLTAGQTSPRGVLDASPPAQHREPLEMPRATAAQPGRFLVPPVRLEQMSISCESKNRLDVRRESAVSPRSLGRHGLQPVAEDDCHDDVGGYEPEEECSGAGALPEKAITQAWAEPIKKVVEAAFWTETPTLSIEVTDIAAMSNSRLYGLVVTPAGSDGAESYKIQRRGVDLQAFHASLLRELGPTLSLKVPTLPTDACDEPFPAAPVNYITLQKSLNSYLASLMEVPAAPHTCTVKSFFRQASKAENKYTCNTAAPLFTPVFTPGSSRKTEVTSAAAAAVLKVLVDAGVINAEKVDERCSDSSSVIGSTPCNVPTPCDNAFEKSHAFHQLPNPGDPSLLDGGLVKLPSVMHHTTQDTSDFADDCSMVSGACSAIALSTVSESRCTSVGMANRGAPKPGGVEQTAPQRAPRRMPGQAVGEFSHACSVGMSGVPERQTSPICRRESPYRAQGSTVDAERVPPRSLDDGTREQAGVAASHSACSSVALRSTSSRMESICAVSRAGSPVIGRLAPGIPSRAGAGVAAAPPPLVSIVPLREAMSDASSTVSSWRMSGALAEPRSARPSLDNAASEYHASSAVSSRRVSGAFAQPRSARSSLDSTASKYLQRTPSSLAGGPARNASNARAISPNYLMRPGASVLPAEHTA